VAPAVRAVEHSVVVHDSPVATATRPADTLRESTDVEVNVGGPPFVDVQRYRTRLSSVADVAPFIVSCRTSPYDTIVVVEADELHDKPRISDDVPQAAGPVGVGLVVNCVALWTSSKLVDVSWLADPLSPPVTWDFVLSTDTRDRETVPTMTGTIKSTRSSSMSVNPSSKVRAEGAAIAPFERETEETDRQR
jgi:hypothetical protein